MLQKLLVLLFLSLISGTLIKSSTKATTCICSVCVCTTDKIDCYRRLRNVVLTSEAFHSIQQSNIHILNLRFNNINNLPQGIFDGLVNLKILDLSWNSLKTLHSALFQNLTLLESLDLQGNKLEGLPHGLLDKQSNLRDLFLSTNNLSNITVSQSIFQNLLKLQNLDFSNNPLYRFPTSIRELSSLKLLSSYNTKLNYISPDTFDKMSQLVELELAENDITVFPDSAVTKLTSLQSFGLAMNRLLAIPIGAQNLPKLQVLTLNENAGFTCRNFDVPSTVSTDIFKCESSSWIKTLTAGLANINDLTSVASSTMTLILKNNGYTSIPAGIFDRFTNLEELDLSYNKIAELPEGIFDKNTKLHKISIAYNGMKHLPNNVFNKLTSLTSLNLAGNQFSYSNIDNIDTLFHNLTKLQMLQLEFNKFDHIPDNWFRDLSSLTELKIFDNQIINLGVNSFAPLKKLTSLDLTGNKLSHIDAGTFSKLSSITRITLLTNNLTMENIIGAFDNATTLSVLLVNSNPGVLCVPANNVTYTYGIKPKKCNETEITMYTDLALANSGTSFLEKKKKKEKVNSHNNLKKNKYFDENKTKMPKRLIAKL